MQTLAGTKIPLFTRQLEIFLYQSYDYPNGNSFYVSIRHGMFMSVGEPSLCAVFEPRGPLW